ncbi:hypothetical protein A1359_18990 [Methylomonas lenta]|uniref:Uncharacterized protein n=1 Tax=Methylomonas lenta TaxID=980561 RepID=A0A177NXP3_9GAMM|nr:DUF4435 domain-containing protein [Methylomonas lenta]OAI21840.1 hypothetical protein A1359_18990 [Methylomonas lenta]
MELKYDIKKYLAKIKMSSKKRVLVEGKDDKSHIKNLLDVIREGHKVKIDTAEDIKGTCEITARNNRAKIDKIYNQCKNSNEYDNLYFLCDREYKKFDISEKISDLMSDHESEGNLSWTIGHSIENYFFKDELLCDAYRYICSSEYKSEAINLFINILPSALKLVAAITLSAKDLDKASYPAGVIGWKHFQIENNVICIDIDMLVKNRDDQYIADFQKHIKKYLPIVDASDALICSRICRGHTAMLMLQRVFASCLNYVIKNIDVAKAEKDALIFSQLKEFNVATALCEAWVRKAKEGLALYPCQLIESVA